MYLPPGPMSLPIFGNLPSLMWNLLRTGDEPEHLLAKMAKKYGEVFSLKVGTKVVVVCNGYKSVKEALQNPFMSDRPKSKVMEETSLDEGNKCCFFSEKSTCFHPPLHSDSSRQSTLVHI